MWKSVIKDPVLLKNVKEKIDEISKSLMFIEDESCSLLGGQPGIILFKNYYSKYMPSLKMDSDQNVQILYDYFEQPLNLNYSYGLAGILYTLNHLEEEEFF